MAGHPLPICERCETPIGEQESRVEVARDKYHAKVHADVDVCIGKLKAAAKASTTALRKKHSEAANEGWMKRPEPEPKPKFKSKK